MGDQQSELRKEAIAQLRRYANLCREEALLRGPAWSGHDEMISTAQRYEVQADVLEVEAIEALGGDKSE